MARIRTIKPEFFRHEELFEAERTTGYPLRVAFAGLWTACDREGRFKWSPRKLRLDCLPYDDVDFADVLEQLEMRGFVVRYACDGSEYGYIPSWQEHQVINNREKESKIPAPPTRDSDASATRELRDDDASKAEGKGKEGKGTRETHASLNATDKTGYAAEFENEWWPAWKQNRISEPVACREFIAARKAGATLTELVEGATLYQSTKPAWQEWKAPANWLREQKWKDQPSKPGDKPRAEPSNIEREWVDSDDGRWSDLVAIFEEQNPGKKVRVNGSRFHAGQGFNFPKSIVDMAVPATLKRTA